MHKQRMTYCTQPPVWTKTASEIPKLKCKAGLSTTLMKSHIKPSRESVCTGGNESEAKPTGSSASYLVPLPFFFSPLSLPCLSLPTQFPPLSLPVPHSPLFTGYLYCTSPITVSPLSFLRYLSCSSFSLLLLSSLRLFPPLSICRCHIWQLSVPD